MLKPFKAPDVKAPRYRPTTFNVLSLELFDKFLEKYPEYKNYDYEDFKKNIVTFNTALWNETIEYRDGVELPESLGNLFIGTCWTSKRKNINIKKSIDLGVTITNKNYETDGKLGKIFYTNYKEKYRFSNRVMWMFIGNRDFKRTVAKTYPKEWKKYIHVDPNQKIAKLYMKHKKMDYMQMKTVSELEFYNEFEL